MKRFLIFAVMLAGCASASRTPCKVTKPREKKPLMTQDAMENEKWRCIPFGIDAKSKGTVWICTNKLDGTRVQVTTIP